MSHSVDVQDTKQSASFTIRLISSTFEQPASICVRQLSQGLLATYYRDSVQHLTSVSSIIDWSSSGNFQGDNYFQIWRVKWNGFLKSPAGAWTVTISKPQSSTDSVRIRLARFHVHLGASNSWSHFFSFSDSVHLAVSIEYTHFAGSLSSGLKISWASEGIAEFSPVPSSAFFADVWSFTSQLNVIVSPAASWSCQVTSPMLSTATAGMSSTFVVSVTDAFGNTATDLSLIKVLLNQLSGCDTLLENSCVRISKSMDQRGVPVTLTVSGAYEVQIIDSKRSEACTYFPQIQVYPGPALLAASLVSLLSATVASAGLPLQFEIISRDQFSNLASLSASQLYFSLLLSCSGPSPCCDSCVAASSTCAPSITCSKAKSSSIMEDVVALPSLGSQALSITFFPTQSGIFRMQILSSRGCSYCDSLPAHTFWNIVVKPSLPSVANLDSLNASLSVVAGDSITISGTSFDMFGNVVPAPDPPTQIECIARINRRAVAGVLSRVFLSSNYKLTCIIKVTTSALFQVSMLSFQGESCKIIQYAKLIFVFQKTVCCQRITAAAH
jgi:hypothetical protein